jgi:uncharacterized protein (TIGR02001 family)
MRGIRSGAGKFMAAITLCVGLSAVSSIAVAGFSGTVAVTTDYDYRGYSQTSGDVALQGSVNYSHDSGFYAFAWGSTLDWGPGTDQDIEVDYVVGFSNPIGETGIKYDVGLLYYDYPGASQSDFLEIYGGFSWNIFRIKVSYSDDFGGLGGDGWYVDGGATYGFENGISLFAYAGYSFGEVFDEDEGLAFGAEDYYNYGIGASYTVAGKLTFDLRGVGTNQDGLYKIESGPFENDFRGIATITLAFP